MAGISARVVAALGGGGGGAGGEGAAAALEGDAGEPGAGAEGARQSAAGGSSGREYKDGQAVQGGGGRAGGGGPRARRARLPQRAVAGADGGPVFTTQGLSNIVWAHAALGVADGPLLRAAVGAVCEKPLLYEARAQEAASLLWALATLGVDTGLLAAHGSNGGGGAGGVLGEMGADEGPAERLAAAALRRPGECGAAEVSNMMWALARLEQHARARQERQALGHDQQQQQMDKDLPSHPIEGLEPAGVAVSAGAAAGPAAGAPVAPPPGAGGPMFAALCRAMLQRLGAASGPDVGQALWACAALRHFDAPTLSALGAAAAALAQTGLLSAAEVATSAWALARLGLRDEGVLRALGDEGAAMASAGRLKDVDVANLAWAFATLEVGVASCGRGDAGDRAVG
ncbi:hypothetical protein MNEG_11107 [Monoraphidium neglectum]|uniref:Uncharacterized protein n=1 Tax=Monoraphidium neglectum TaxID=145388 RepID=A0A0D2KM88_9CHLO|nr:hypothetical protein MNEG_11107 [Monoraphidium neglectum]KIY96858.1 hypothetical protein MNEG_11107 [Monoraphidium neglectum]|eukprot:XP_013895878.1 hypothetical protein MNEG_11107 [Monoraphidium neglectum]